MVGLLDSPDVAKSAAAGGPDLSLQPSAESASDSPTFSIRVKPLTLMKALAVVVLVLIGLSLVAHGFLGAVPDQEMRGLRQVAMRFDMDRENTLPEWFSSLLLFSCAFVLATIGVRHRRTSQQFAWHWLVLSLAFVYLSIDESVGLHEILMVPIRRRLNTSGIFYFGWVIVALPLVAVMFLAYLRFLWNLRPRTRWLFILAGCLYVGGALGMEMVGGALVESGGFYTLRYTLAMTVEESFEMLGASLFLCALIDYCARTGVGRTVSQYRASNA